MEELHSACTEHGIVPVQEESNSNKLVFTHATGGEDATAVSPPTVKSVIEYKASTLTQTDYPTGSNTAESEQVLLSNVVPKTTGELFHYFSFASGSTPLSATQGLGPLAREVILINAALTASPRSTPVADAGAAATVQDSATLRLTPPASSGTEAKPCE
jgi:hypothetical protein